MFSVINVIFGELFLKVKIKNSLVNNFSVESWVKYVGKGKKDKWMRELL